MIRLGFTTGTPTKRLQAFGKVNKGPRKVHVVYVVALASKVHTAYLVRHAEVSGFRIKYVATKSNNPRRPKIIGLSDDILSNAIVILPASLRPSDDDITKLRLAGYAVFDQWKKQDYTNLRDFLPANSADTAMFFIIVGPKCLPLVLQDMPYHGPADDDAVAVIATTHGEAVASMFINMGQHFQKDAQSFINAQANTFPDCIFKKQHCSRTLCQDFATKVDGLADNYEDKASSHVQLLEQEIRTMVPLPAIPRKDPGQPAPPVPRDVQLHNDKPHDDDTLATSGNGTVTSALTKKRIKIILQLGKPPCSMTS